VPTTSATRKPSGRKATAKRPVAKKSAKRSAKQATNGARTRRRDAIALLKDDHREVERLFNQYQKSPDASEREKRRLVDAMTTALSKHTAIEEQIVYPWARDTIEGADDTVLEAFEEHRVVKWLLTELTTLPAGDERFDAKVTVTIELVRQHVEEEESELFPDLRAVATRRELLDLGDQLRAAKARAPGVSALGGLGVLGAAMEHARDVGKEVVDRIGALTGVE
jgi:hemerythrin superfamily protein